MAITPRLQEYIDYFAPSEVVIAFWEWVAKNEELEGLKEGDKDVM